MNPCATFFERDCISALRAWFIGNLSSFIEINGEVSVLSFCSSYLYGQRLICCIQFLSTIDASLARTVHGNIYRTIWKWSNKEWGSILICISRRRKTTYEYNYKNYKYNSSPNPWFTFFNSRGAIVGIPHINKL